MFPDGLWSEEHHLLRGSRHPLLLQGTGRARRARQRLTCRQLGVNHARSTPFGQKPKSAQVPYI